MGDTGSGAEEPAGSAHTDPDPAGWLLLVHRIPGNAAAEFTSDTIPNTASAAERRGTQSHLSWTPDTRGGRKECAVFAGLLGIVLLLFELALVARMVVDWLGVVSPTGGRSGLYQARRITHGITEPVIGPVRRVLKPARFGSVSIDLAFTAVFLAVIVLRTVVVPLIPF